jgi:Icc-related predicted phosphoesterase
MKILAIGDFHGKIPEKLKKVLLKREYDFILCNGDFPESEKIRKLIFKNWAEKPWWEVIGMKKAQQIEKESFNSGVKILKQLNSLGKKTHIVWGNTDFYESIKKRKRKSRAKSPISPGDYKKTIRKLKNIILIDRKKSKISGLEILGHGRYVDVTEFIRHPIDKDKDAIKYREERYNKDKNTLFKLFKKNKPKNFIFLTHYTPYKILDKIKLKGSPMYNKPAGFEPYNQIIKKFKPLLMVCGHMHENPGKKNAWKNISCKSRPGL